MIIDYEPYILNEQNMTTYLKYKLPKENINKKENINSRENIHKKENINKKEQNDNVKNANNIFIPQENDTLFWCYYIILNGDADYEILPSKNVLVEKQLKIKYVSTIRENKQIIKTHKFDSLTNIESNLANDKYININTFLILCILEKKNILFIKNKCFVEYKLSDSNEFYITTSLEKNKYGFYKLENNEKIKNTYLKVSNLEKPLKPIVNYKIEEIIEMCKIIGIEYIHPITKKNKLKKELYDELLNIIKISREN